RSGTDRAGTRLAKGASETLVALRIVPEPVPDLRRRPLGVATRVAAVARIRRAELHRLVGARHAQAVIVTRVDHHVGRGRHVTAHALGAGAAGRVMMVCRVVELRRLVTLSANRVALGAQLAAVRLMAIAAGDTGRVHAALQERAPVVDLAALLSV